jgi:hypothetical protein
MHELFALQFSDQVSLGNILSIISFLTVGLGAFFDLRSRAKSNAKNIEELVRRLNTAELEKLKVCVDTMWLFQLRRGLTEVETKGLGKINSPVQLTDQANELMKPLLRDLREFYETINGEQLGIVELAVAIEQQFGHRLIEEVCKKVGITDAACLVLAIGQLRPIGPNTLRAAHELCGEPNVIKRVFHQKYAR